MSFLSRACSCFRRNIWVLMSLWSPEAQDSEFQWYGFCILPCSRSHVKPWASKYFLASGRCCSCPISLTSASHFLDVFLFLAPIWSLPFNWIRGRTSLALLPGNKGLVCSGGGELLMGFSDSCNLLSRGKCSYLWSKGQVLLLKHLLEQWPLLSKVKPGQLKLLS